MLVKKAKRSNKSSKQDEALPSQEVGLAQSGEPTCFCCGEKHYLQDCKRKGVLSKEEWNKPSYWKQCYVDEESKRQEKREKEKVQASSHLQTKTVCGFCSLQEDKKLDGPKEIMDSCSTVKLMKSKEIVSNIRHSNKKLKLATNGGKKIVNETCDVPGFGGD